MRHHRSMTVPNNTGPVVAALFLDLADVRNRTLSASHRKQFIVEKNKFGRNKKVQVNH